MLSVIDRYNKLKRSYINISTKINVVNISTKINVVADNKMMSGINPYNVEIKYDTLITNYNNLSLDYEKLINEYKKMITTNASAKKIWNKLPYHKRIKLKSLWEFDYYFGHSHE